MKKLSLLILAMISLLFSGCGEDQSPAQGKAYVKPPVIPAVIPQQKKETVRYVYHGDRFKDPFIAISAASAPSMLSDDVPVPTLGALVLKGIIDDGKQATAIISAGGITYVLKGRRLYDNRQRLVKGITGVIGADSVLMIGNDKSTKELKLREKP
jgi:Tfp pilus assembly protein PilP